MTSARAAVAATQATRIPTVEFFIAPLRAWLASLVVCDAASLVTAASEKGFADTAAPWAAAVGSPGAVFFANQIDRKHACPRLRAPARGRGRVEGAVRCHVRRPGLVEE